MKNKLNINDDLKYIIGEFYSSTNLNKGFKNKMSRKSNDTTAIIIGCIIALPIIVGISALSGWVLMLLWNWALVGIFPTVPILDFWKAWGLSLLLAFVGGFFRSSSK